MEKIFYTKPSITDVEIRYTTEAATTGWGDQCYAHIERFETRFKTHLGVSHAVATASCTGAMHLGLAALGVGPGDEVILGDINWIATAAPIRHLGATPILVDVLEDTWCIDPKKAEAAITPRTKAIIAVHLYGNLCDMKALLEIGRKHGIPVVEDAAEAIGSLWHGHRAGSLGHFGTFSFHGTKTITTGEGGMLVTRDPQFFEKVLTLSNHGRRRGEKRQFWPSRVGFKYKMSNIQAAIGCGQMDRIDSLIERKRAIFYRYRDRLSDLPLAMNPEPEGTVNGFWMPTVVAARESGFNRERLLSSFERQQIDGRVFFWPLSTLDLFPGQWDTPVARSLSPRAVNLPSYHDLSNNDIDRVATVVREEFQKARA